MSKHYVIDENHNFVEGYSAQEVLSVLEQAIADGSLANVVAGQAIVDKLKCCVTGGTNQVAFVTQAKYNELKASDRIVANCLYIITDDTTADDIEASLVTINQSINEIVSVVNGILDGSKTVPNATNARQAENATNAKSAEKALGASYLSGMSCIEAQNEEIFITGKGIYAVVWAFGTLINTDLIVITDLNTDAYGTHTITIDNGATHYLKYDSATHKLKSIRSGYDLKCAYWLAVV
jgi:hypothetical protein